MNLTVKCAIGHNPKYITFSFEAIPGLGIVKCQICHYELSAEIFDTGNISKYCIGFTPHNRANIICETSEAPGYGRAFCSLCHSQWMMIIYGNTPKISTKVQNFYDIPKDYA